MLQHLRRIASQNLVVQTIASALAIECWSAEKLIRTFVSIPDGAEPALDLFLADGFVPSISENGQPPDFQATTSPDQFPQHYAIYNHLTKVAFVLETLKVPADGIEFFFTNGAAAGWPDLNALPLEPVEQPVTELIRLFEYGGTLPGSRNSFRRSNYSVRSFKNSGQRRNRANRVLGICRFTIGMGDSGC